MNQRVIRRLASARRRKDWRAVLKELEEIERDAWAAARLDVRGAGPRGGAYTGGGGAGGRGAGGGRSIEGRTGGAWRVWCAEGLAPADAERARTTVYNIVMDVLGSKKRCVRTSTSAVSGEYHIYAALVGEVCT